MTADGSGAGPEADGGRSPSTTDDASRDRRLGRTARVMGTRRYRQARRRLRSIGDRADDPVAPALVRAAAPGELEDLFEYPRKRLVTAYLLWLVAGLLGAHRFYLDREGTAVAQFLTGGGLLIWWAVDVALVPFMVRDYNRDQAEREAEGRPPRALDFLETVDEAEAEAGDAGGTGIDGAADGSEPDGSPEPVARWDVPAWADDRASGRGRLAADLAVVSFAGLALGTVSASLGSWRAAAAVATVVLAISLAPELSALRRLPGAGDLLRWAARLGLFYRYHDPGGPVRRLARPLVGMVYAPFRRRDRAETHLYLELGGAFAALFFLVDLAVLGGSALAEGPEVLELSGVVQLGTEWAAAALLTLLNVYAFATPIGATLYEHALTGRSHRRVWLLGATSLAGMALGLVAA